MRPLRRQAQRPHDLRLFTAIASLSPSAIGFLASVASAQLSSSASEAFSVCGSGQRITCVVDGDTFWFRGEKIRIADIDTPELSPRDASANASEVLRRNNVCSRSSIRVQSRSRRPPGMKIASVASPGSSTAIGDRLAIYSLQKAWRGSGKDRAGAGANDPGAGGSLL